jgi:hypothetical protein
MQSRNDLILHHTLSSLEKKMNGAPCHIGAIIKHQSVDVIPVAHECQGMAGHARLYRGTSSL